ncbi:MAG: acyl--CoA ligase [Actinomycetota bacterium]|nr:acyl--CoA ligase [Actinomycetota bacterium]
MAAETLAPSLDVACERWADRPAITFGDETITYSRLGERLRALAAAYHRLGIGPGDRVLCQLPDRPEHVMAMHAAWANGAIHVGGDHDLTAQELSWLVGWTGAAALLFQPRADGPDPLAPVRAVREAHPETRLLLQGATVDGGGVHALGELLEPAGALPTRAPPLLGPDDTGLLLLTSGTTGKPKGVMETLPHCWAKMQFFADAFRPGPDDVHLLYLPMAHVFGLRLSLLALLSGGRLVLLDRFSPEAALRLVGEEGVTVLPGMPTHFRLLLDRLDRARHDVGSLRWAVSAATSMPRPLAEAIYSELGAEILYVYGCSEGFTTETIDRDDILCGSVGSTVFRGPPGAPPDGRVAVMDPETGDLLAPGQVGEIVFGAAHPVRYWRAPEVATDGWYHTGDLGRVDEDGRVFVLGRLKELVNRAGLKVAPSEVEAAIVRHAGVADAAVIATPDPVLSEATCACVVPTDGEPPGLADLRAFLAPTLARHKLPDELCVVQRIPRTRVGKVDRAALAKQVLDGDLPRERLRPR